MWYGSVRHRHDPDPDCCPFLQVAAPTSAGEEARAAELANRSANQAKLIAAGALEALFSLALQDGGVSSLSVRSHVSINEENAVKVTHLLLDATQGFIAFTSFLGSLLSYVLVHFDLVVYCGGVFLSKIPTWRDFRICALFWSYFDCAGIAVHR